MGDTSAIKKEPGGLTKVDRRRSWRGILASLAAAIGASFAITSTVPAATPPLTQQPALAQEVRGNKRVPKLVLRSGARLVRFAQHESHESHESHSSHSSHYSGYSQ